MQMIDLFDVAVPHIKPEVRANFRRPGPGLRVYAYEDFRFENKRIIIPRKCWTQEYRYKTFLRQFNRWYKCEVDTEDLNFPDDEGPFTVMVLYSFYKEDVTCKFLRKMGRERWSSTLYYRHVDMKETVRKQFLYLSEYFPVEVLYVVLQYYLPLL